MTHRRYKVVDVFTQEPLRGNPVAVVLDAEGLDAAHMQRIAGWVNLSETTFVSPSSRGAYRARIFTPGGELPFAGHPTLGTAHAVREGGLVPAERTQFAMECGAGLVDISVEQGGALSIVTPQATVAKTLDPDDAGLRATLRGLSIARPVAINLGPTWIVARVAAAESLLGYVPDLAALHELSVRVGALGITLYAPTPEGLEVRTFAPAVGIVEDPVCGSGNPAIALHLDDADRARLGPSWVARQGRVLGRDGRVQVGHKGGRITLGGHCVTVVNGTLSV